MIRSALQPYPDELLSSALIRFCRHYRTSSHKLGQDVLNLPGWRLSFVGGLPLPPICELLGTSAEELLRRHTPLPYAGAFTTHAVHRRCWSDALAGAESPPLRALMCNATSLPGMRKFCSSCVRDDVLTHGESFWHLSHQLPGVLACTRHGRALRWTTTSFNIKGPAQLVLPSECRGRQIRLHPPTMISIAIDSVDLLGTQEPDERSAHFYRQMAESSGYLDPDRQVSRSALGHLLTRRFSATFLKTHGLLDDEGIPSWAANMFRPNVYFGHAPIKHVLVEMALTTGSAGSPGCLNFKSSGPPASDDDAVDAHYSRAARKVLSEAIQEERVFTTEQFLRAAGCYGAYKHRKDRMPKLRHMVLAFRSSAASVKPLNEGKMLFRKRPDETASGIPNG